MKKIVLLLLLIFAFPVQAIVSSQEAVEFVSLKNNFLFENEQAEIFPNIQIGHAKQGYWVIAIVAGENLNVLVPLSAKDEGEIAKTDSEKRQLIRAGFIIRNYSLLKDELAKQDKWVFSTAKVKNVLQPMVRALADERFDLATVRSELNAYTDIQAGIDLVREDLDELGLKLEETEKGFSGMVELEAAFLNKPDTNAVDRIKKDFDEAIEGIKEAETLYSSYLSELDKVRQSIAQTELSIETKRSIGNLLGTPKELQGLKSMTAAATFFQDELQKLFDNALATRDTLLANLETRIEKSIAFQELFGSNSELIEKTNGDFSTLKGIADYILSPELGEKGLVWKEESELVKLKENWKKAQAYYNAGNYSLAEQFARQATASALKIFKQGFQEIEQEGGANISLLINGAIVLVVLLIILLAARNRKKLLALVSEPLEGREYE